MDGTPQVGDLRLQRWNGASWAEFAMLTGDELLDTVQAFVEAEWYGYIDINVGESASEDDRAELRRLITIVLNGRTMTAGG